MAGSELPHRYVGACRKCPEIFVSFQDPSARLWNNSEAYRFSISADARPDSFLFFLSKTTNSLIDSNPCNLGRWRGSLRVGKDQ
jgi:hypothetical protein